MGDEEVEKLEVEVNEMAEKISEYRSSLPDKLTSTLSSFLVAQRPVLDTHFDAGSGSGSEPGPYSASSLDGERPVLSSTTALLAQEDKEYAQKIVLLKEKLANNALAMPNVLTRMKECISRIDKLESRNGIIHPAFKRKRTS